MKTWKTILALILIVALVGTLFAACAQQDPPSNNSTSSTSNNSTSSNSSTNSEDEDGDEDGMPVISFYMLDLRGFAGDYGKPVHDAIDELCKREIGVSVNTIWPESGTWQNAVLLAISSGEPIDVCCAVMSNSVGNMYANSQLMDISALMDEYAPETVELMKDYLNVCSFNGGLYGVPTYRNYVKNGYIIMNAEILDDLGLREKAENMQTFTEYEEILQAVKENYTDVDNSIYPFGSNYGLWSIEYVSNGDNFADYDVYDSLGTSQYVVYCGQDGKVELLQEVPHYIEECARVADWMEKGLVWPDSVFSTDFQDDLMRSKTLFSVALGSELGVETTKKNAYGYEVVCKQLCSGMIKTSEPATWGLGVPITSEEPEAACKFINELYTNPELMNILIWGIEGSDYTIVDGLVQHVAEDHYSQADFIVGNNLLLTPLYGNSPDLYQQAQKLNESAPKSNFMGFSIDTTELSLVLSQISAVQDQYAQAMRAGGYNPETYSDYISKLEAAGVRDYLSEIQTQLDAWLAAQ